MSEHAQKKHNVGNVSDTIVNYAKSTIRQILTQPLPRRLAGTGLPWGLA